MDNTDGTNNAGDQGGAGDAQPTIADLISWDEAEKGAPPPVEAVPLAELRAFITTHEGELIERVKNETKAEYDQRIAAERTRNEQMGTAQADINWAKDIETRLASPDEDVRAAATSEKDADRERFLRGLALDYQRTTSAQSEAALNRHYEPLFNGLIAAGHKAVVDSLANADELNTKYGGNHLLAMVEYGKSLGDAAGYARGVEETERRLRTDELANGGPTLTNPGGGRDPIAGIDPTKPGAGLAMMRAAASAGRR